MKANSIRWLRVKVEMQKFDNLLGRLLKAKPMPEKKVKTPKEAESQADYRAGHSAKIVSR